MTIEITGLYLSYISNIYDYLEKSFFTNFDVKIKNPILYYLYCYKSQADNYNNLAGKTICVDFVETENNIDLYRKYGKLVYILDKDENFWEDEKYMLIEEGIDYDNMSDEEIEKIRKENIKKYFYSGDFDYESCFSLYNYDYKKYTERELLKTIGAWPETLNSRIIYVGEGIDGEKLDATEEDVIKYVNSINADMYMRVMIYDNPVKINEYGGFYGGIVGYYNEANEEIAKVYKEGLEYYLKGLGEIGILKLLTNEYVKNNSEIPTIGHFAYYRTYEDGKYLVNYLDSYTDGLRKVYNALETDSAKQLISKNREKNETIKQNVEESINNLEILDNELEIQEEIKSEKPSGENLEQNNSNLNNNDLNKDAIIISSFIVLIGVGIVVIIVDNKRKNGGISNEKK